MSDRTNALNHNSCLLCDRCVLMNGRYQCATRGIELIESAIQLHCAQEGLHNCQSQLVGRQINYHAQSYLCNTLFIYLFIYLFNEEFYTISSTDIGLIEEEKMISAGDRSQTDCASTCH